MGAGQSYPGEMWASLAAAPLLHTFSVCSFYFPAVWRSFSLALTFHFWLFVPFLSLRMDSLFPPPLWESLKPNVLSELHLRALANIHPEQLQKYLLKFHTMVENLCCLRLDLPQIPLLISIICSSDGAAN